MATSALFAAPSHSSMVTAQHTKMDKSDYFEAACRRKCCKKERRCFDCCDNKWCPQYGDFFAPSTTVGTALLASQTVPFVNTGVHNINRLELVTDNTFFPTDGTGIAIRHPGVYSVTFGVGGTSATDVPPSVSLFLNGVQQNNFNLTLDQEVTTISGTVIVTENDIRSTGLGYAVLEVVALTPFTLSNSELTGTPNTGNTAYINIVKIAHVCPTPTVF